MADLKNIPLWTEEDLAKAKTTTLVISQAGMDKLFTDIEKSIDSAGGISDDDLEKAKKDLSRLAMRRVVDKNGHQRIVYVKVGEDNKETDFGHGDKVTYEHNGKKHTGTITGLKYHDKFDPHGTATVKSDSGEVHSKSLRALNHVDSGSKVKTTIADKFKQAQEAAKKVEAPFSEQEKKEAKHELNFLKEGMKDANGGEKKLGIVEQMKQEEAAAQALLLSNLKDKNGVKLAIGDSVSVIGKSTTNSGDKLTGVVEKVSVGGTITVRMSESSMGEYAQEEITKVAAPLTPQAAERQIREAYPDVHLTTKGDYKSAEGRKYFSNGNHVANNINGEIEFFETPPPADKPKPKPVVDLKPNDEVFVMVEGVKKQAKVQKDNGDGTFEVKIKFGDKINVSAADLDMIPLHRTFTGKPFFERMHESYNDFSVDELQNMQEAYKSFARKAKQEAGKTQRAYDRERLKLQRENIVSSLYNNGDSWVAGHNREAEKFNALADQIKAMAKQKKGGKLQKAFDTLFSK